MRCGVAFNNRFAEHFRSILRHHAQCHTLVNPGIQITYRSDGGSGNVCAEGNNARGPEERCLLHALSSAERIALREEDVAVFVDEEACMGGSVEGEGLVVACKCQLLFQPEKGGVSTA